ncbi:MULTISPECIES: acetyltransferase [unclassified Oleiphilus]|uniref:acetyltransferase n=1 Tax=unclassified Oleiphilus TaxID=2631174 RepID=UPI0007C2A4A8|nr:MULTISPECIES: acetyltransferase [unclassified Oleiphilus]KZZ37146.1 hypothetical protein A3757_12350 [Oleiphilus sp. HI0117]KZZ53773.1 hypothetical protein A3761_16230 [Oleiphilus sp. HI0123]
MAETGLNKKLIIYGNGHMAKMIFQFVKTEFEVVAFTVDRQCIAEPNLCGLPLVPFDEIEQSFSTKDCFMLIAVGYVQMNQIRENKYLEAKDKGYKFINYIHPSVVIHDEISIGVNNIILDHASVHPYCVIGNGNFISSNSNIGHGCSLGDNNWMNAGVSIGGETKVEDKVFFGINSAVGHGIVIKAESFIGGHALISRDTDIGGVYLAASADKHRLGSQAFLKFSSAMSAN